MRQNQSNIFPFDVLTADGFINDIKPSDKFVAVNLMNCGNTILYLWTDVKIEAGASLPISCDQTAFISLSRVPVHFDLSSATVPANKLVVLVERITYQEK